jgi:hypothetical protein
MRTLRARIVGQDFTSIGQLCGLLQVLPAEVEHAAKLAGVRAMRFDNVPFFTSTEAAKIRQQLREAKR